MNLFETYWNDCEIFAVCQNCNTVWTIEGQGWVKHPLNAMPMDVKSVAQDLLIYLGLPPNDCCEE